MPNQIVQNRANTIADTRQVFFTAPLGGNGTQINSVTASNNSTVSASYKAYIVSTSTVQPQIPFEIVVWGRNDLGIGLVNQVIPAGATLELETSAIDSIYFTATGRTV